MVWLEDKQHVTEAKRRREKNRLVSSKTLGNRCEVSMGSRPRPSEMEEVDQSQARGGRTNVTNPIYFLKEQRGVKSFGLTGWALHIKAFVSTGKCFTSSQCSLAKIRMGKSILRNLHVFFSVHEGKNTLAKRFLQSKSHGVFCLFPERPQREEPRQ